MNMQLCAYLICFFPTAYKGNKQCCECKSCWSWKTNRQMLLGKLIIKRRWQRSAVWFPPVLCATRETGTFYSIVFYFLYCAVFSPVPTPTYFLHLHKLTAVGDRMNSTFLPLRAVTDPRTAEARLINETKQDVASLADSYVWNNLLEMQLHLTLP